MFADALIALTSAINAYLGGRHGIAHDLRRLPAFQHANMIAIGTFADPPPSSLGPQSGLPVRCLPDPELWLPRLTTLGVRRAYVRRSPLNHTTTPISSRVSAHHYGPPPTPSLLPPGFHGTYPSSDQGLSAFVPTNTAWYAQLVHRCSYSLFVLTSQTLTIDGQERSGAILLLHASIARRQSRLQYDLSVHKRRLRDALLAIDAYSRQHCGNFFSDRFNAALQALDSPDPLASLAPHSMVAPELFPLAARQLFAASSIGWVFGGMSWWNDQPWDITETPAYKRVSAALHDALCDAKEAAGNAFSRPR